MLHRWFRIRCPVCQGWSGIREARPPDEEHLTVAVLPCPHCTAPITVLFAVTDGACDVLDVVNHETHAHGSALLLYDPLAGKEVH